MRRYYRVVILWLITSTIISLLLRCKFAERQNKLDINQEYVPDSTMAIQIAEIMFVRFYGEQVLEKKPFIAVLKKGIWMVDGSLDEGIDGGVPHIEIQKSDGKIVKLYHSK